MCEGPGTSYGEKRAMKVNVEVDCTPEEARRFLGLPDVSRANDIYVDAIANAMKGVTSLDQLGTYAKQLAPMGEIGMNMFKQFMEQGAGAAMAGFKAGAPKKKD